MARTRSEGTAKRRHFAAITKVTETRPSQLAKQRSD